MMTWWYCRVSFFLSIVVHRSCSGWESGITVSQFKFLSGHWVSGRATELSRDTDPSLIRCAAMCDQACGMIQFSNVSQVCVIFVEELYQVEVSPDPDWVIGFRNSSRNTVIFGNWTLAFRLQAAIAVPSYETWIQDGRHDDSPLVESFPLACLRMFDYASCDRHFRSRILDNWTSVSEVYLSLIKNGTEEAFVHFNGTGSDRMSWFDEHRIINSTWLPGVKDYPNLNDKNSIAGHCSTRYCRRFFLHRKYGTSCPYDAFYLIIYDVDYDTCDGDRGPYKVQDPPPTIHYSPTSGLASFASKRGAIPLGDSADVMAIYVRFD